MRTPLPQRFVRHRVVARKVQLDVSGHKANGASDGVKSTVKRFVTSSLGASRPLVRPEGPAAASMASTSQRVPDSLTEIEIEGISRGPD
jgi:hypothetical protein